jgi:hypothetical protein
MNARDRVRPDREQGINGSKPGPAPAAGTFFRDAGVRLLLFPLLVYAVWLLEVYLFGGRSQLFLHPEPFGLLFYTVMTCIFVGQIVPVFLIRRAFLSGDVNMHQLGFRSLRRTILMTFLSLVIVWLAVVLQNPFGTDRIAFLSVFLLLLPTGIASALICCVLAGTHVQAFVRNGGVVMAITAGAIVSGLLFGLTIFAYLPGSVTPGTLPGFVSAGVLAAIFFFAVRDIWATSVTVTGGLAYLMAPQLDPAQLLQIFPVMVLAVILTSVTLVAIQWYFSRHYVTIPVPVS